jgi:hypothetical protein
MHQKYREVCCACIKVDPKRENIYSTLHNTNLSLGFGSIFFLEIGSNLRCQGGVCLCNLTYRAFFPHTSRGACESENTC